MFIFSILPLLSFISLTLCQNSGIKVNADLQLFDLISQINWISVFNISNRFQHVKYNDTLYGHNCTLKIEKFNLAKIEHNINTNVSYSKIKEDISELTYYITGINATFDISLYYNYRTLSDKITNIYLGVNFGKNESKTQKDILETCKRNNIKITQMVLSEINYSIKVKR